MSNPAEHAPQEAQSSGSLREAVIAALRQVHDPEIPVNVYDLGLIYECRVEDEGRVDIRMTLTAPGCPIADLIVAQVEGRVKQVPGVREVKVQLVWEPPWTPERMSDAARLQLNMPPSGGSNPSRLRVLGNDPPRT